ncbi:MAG TPA: HEAT repeat domain-containing protein, partial [bacterium]
KILSHHVQDLLNKIPKRQHGFMVRIFEALKTEEDTKRLLSFGDLQKELKIKKPERLAKMMDKFSDLHLLRYEEKEQNKWYEFKHDYLVGEITKWMQRRKDQLAKKRFRYAIAPGIVLALVLLTWAIIEFNRFEARFTDQKYAEQQQEVFIKRRFNPFGFRVTTGILYDQLKDYDAKNDVKNGFIVSVGRKNDWRRLIEIISPWNEGKEFYCIGIYGSDVDKIIEALQDSLWNVRYQAAGALGTLGQADASVIKALVAALGDNDRNVRSQAAGALVTLGKADASVIKALVDALGDNDSDVRSQAAGALGTLLKSKAEKELIDKFLKNELSGYRTAGAHALASQDSLPKDLLDEINALKDTDKRPWVRLGAWEAYELIQERQEKEEKNREEEAKANRFINKADSLFEISKFSQAENQYKSAFYKLKEIIRIDSLKIARIKFQQARCTAKMKRLVPSLDHLEIVFQYNKAWRDTLRTELAQKESDWAFMKENWYLNEVLLQNSKPQKTNIKPVR